MWTVSFFGHSPYHFPPHPTPLLSLFAFCMRFLAIIRFYQLAVNIPFVLFIMFHTLACTSSFPHRLFMSVDGSFAGYPPLLLRPCATRFTFSVVYVGRIRTRDLVIPWSGVLPRTPLRNEGLSSTDNCGNDPPLQAVFWTGNWLALLDLLPRCPKRPKRECLGYSNFQSSQFHDYWEAPDVVVVEASRTPHLVEYGIVLLGRLGISRASPDGPQKLEYNSCFSKLSWEAKNSGVTLH